MRRTSAQLLIVFSLALGSAARLPAQSLSAGRFLEGVSTHPVDDESDRDQAWKIYESLNIASPSQVERELPTVLRYARAGNEDHVRGYAALLLTAIAIRPDGAALLSTKPEELAQLIVDANPAIQKVAVAIMDYVIGKPATDNQPYLAALKRAIRAPQAAQEVVLTGMISPLLVYGSSDPDALKSVLAFLHRDDLTASTRIELVHQLGVDREVPREVNQYLVERLDDPDAQVRAAAVVSYADSKTAFHALGKQTVRRMAKDPKENPQVRELAKAALAGKTSLNPNINLPPDAPNGR